MFSTSKLVFRTVQVAQIGKSAALFAKPKTPFVFRTQQLSNRTTSGLKAIPKTKTWKETIMAPAGDGAFSVGKGLVAGGSLFALGSLCFYGAGMSKEVGIYDKSMAWPEYVRTRVRDTYIYFGNSILVTAGSAATIYRNPVLRNLVSKNSMMAIGVSIAAMIGTQIWVKSIPYTEGFGLKQIAWLTHCSVIGGVIAPMCVLGGPLLMKAALYTGGIVAGLSCLAACAPSEKYLTMGGPLAIGFGCVFASSIGSLFLPPTTALGAGLYSIALYGGLVLFGGFLLYDTQKIVHRAERHPPNAIQPFDPINASMGIYLDTINIFIRIATIMSGGGNRKR